MGKKCFRRVDADSPSSFINAPVGRIVFVIQTDSGQTTGLEPFVLKLDYDIISSIVI